MKVLHCTCRHRPVIAKTTETHVLIRRGKAWWLIEGRLVTAKCPECGRIVAEKQTA